MNRARRRRQKAGKGRQPVVDAQAGSKARVDRQTVNLSEYPDLVVVYLGMRVEKLQGLGKLFQTGRRIQAAVAERPEGLLRHEFLLLSVAPPHLGMRQYWRNLDALEQWTRDLPHKQWWQEFLRDPEGTGFWHETYFMRGGMEAIFDNMGKATGLMSFAPTEKARGRMFSARSRLGLGEPHEAPVIAEEELVD